jgi:hypothetical protein
LYIGMTTEYRTACTAFARLTASLLSIRLRVTDADECDAVTSLSLR